jgi:hypothetical protein
MKKILIVGRNKNGKTTFANYLVELMGNATAMSTSGPLVRALCERDGLCESEVLADKAAFRVPLAEIGNEMCASDSGALVKECLADCDTEIAIIDGARRLEEVTSTKDLFDKIVWIERPVDTDSNDNLAFGSEVADIVIDNDGDLLDLKKKAFEFKI